jgi:hypothetical protein
MTKERQKEMENEIFFRGILEIGFPLSDTSPGAFVVNESQEFIVFHLMGCVCVC